MSIEEAGRRYLQLVKPANAAASRYNREIRKAHPSIRTLRKLARAEAVVDRRFLLGLADETLWPKAVRPQVRKIADAMGQQLSHDRAISHAKTQADLDQADADFPTVSNSAAQVLRAKLGIAEVPTI
jgi:hypothetical protein